MNNDDKRKIRKKKTDLTLEELAEIRASAKRYEAEARQADAEATFALVQAEQVRHEVKRSQILSEIEELNLKEVRIRHGAALASDPHHQVYRFTEEVEPETVSDCMAHLTLWNRTKPNCDMEIIFTSPGGCVISGLALFDYIQALKRKGHRVITKTYGMAASMAGILLQAGTERVTGKEAWMLIHEGSCGAIGDVAKVIDRVEWIKRIGERIVNIFAERATLKTRNPVKEIAAYIRKNWDRKDWWLDSDQMLKLGFVDRVE